MVDLCFFSPMVGGQEWMHFGWTMLQADAETASLWSISGASLSLWMLGATNHKKVTFSDSKTSFDSRIFVSILSLQHSVGFKHKMDLFN